MGQPFSHFAEQEARAHEIAKGVDIMEHLLATLPPGARVVLQVHDEIMIECTDDIALDAVEDLMREPMPPIKSIYACTVPVSMDSELDEKWPPISKEDKEEMMRMAYGGKHNHVTTECSGSCTRCGE